MVVHRSRNVARAADLILGGQDAGGAEEQRCGGRGAQREVEGAVWADGDARGDGCAGCVVGGSGVEFLLGNLLENYAKGWRK